MQYTSRRLSVVSGLFLTVLTALPSIAQQQTAGFYFNVNAGPAFAEDVDLDEFIVLTPGAELELDPGVDFSVAGGFNFNDFVGVQLHTGIIANEIDNLNGDSVIGHVPLMGDVVFRYDRPNFRLIPYIGAGAGGDFSFISLDEVRLPGGGIVDGDESDFVFAWHAFAGARFRLNDNMSIGAGYKFHWSDSASWDVSHTAGDIKIDSAQVHSGVVDFTMKF